MGSAGIHLLGPTARLPLAHVGCAPLPSFPVFLREGLLTVCLCLHCTRQANGHCSSIPLPFLTLFGLALPLVRVQPLDCVLPRRVIACGQELQQVNAEVETLLPMAVA